MKKFIFRDVDFNPDGSLAALTRKIFTNFVLPVGLKSGTWVIGELSKVWSQNLIADLQTSRVIRHVLREENARSKVFGIIKVESRVFRFRDNEDILMGKCGENKDILTRKW